MIARLEEKSRSSDNPAQLQVKLKLTVRFCRFWNQRHGRL